MAAPFSGEDIVKRGIFSALIGLRTQNKSGPTKPAQPVPPSSNPWQEFDEQQPCSTWRLRQHDQQQVQATSSLAGQRSLSQQLENTFLASPEQQQKVMMTSPHDIFQEILCECGPMEHAHMHMIEQHGGQVAPTNQQTFPSPQSDPWFATANTDYELNTIGAEQQPQFLSHQAPTHFANQQSSDPQHNTTIEDPLVCPNCVHPVELVRLSTLQRQGVQIGQQQRRENLSTPPYSIHPTNTPWTHQSPQSHPYRPPSLQQQPLVTAQSSPANESHQQLKQIFNSGNLSIEEFVKMIASTIKDSGLLKGGEKPMSPMSNESPEEILRRKRQQNNEAAARYRRRQKEAKLTKNEEMEQLTERNKELRQQINEIQGEMHRIRGFLQTKH